MRALSQEDLARLVEVRVKTINRWETGRNEPQAAQLRKLAAALDCSIPWLLDGDGSGEPVEQVA
jgi:transcriptional regulator with XRE-family HTH domain